MNRVQEKALDMDLYHFYEEWIRENGTSLFKYIYSLVKHKELAEDLYQDVLIAAYLALPSFEEKAKLKGWLFKIAVNKCRDYWRKEKSTKRFWEEKVHMYDVPRDATELPEEVVLNKCSKEEMVGSIGELPQIYRDPLFLFYYQQQSLLEICSITNLPISTVKTRMKRAKDRLKPKVQSLVAM